MNQQKWSKWDEIICEIYMKFNFSSRLDVVVKNLWREKKREC